MEKENIVRERSFRFAVKVVALSRTLSEERKEFVLSRQLLRSGTSIGANIREADNAESKADFIHKMSVAQKECDETIYWLELMNASGIISGTSSTELVDDAAEILRIIKRIIITAKASLRP
ncbi:MAG: four helix bundle protein [Bacteroidetes bacterium]|nr:MAG: four helix bundle protein [Bacteroidota bacterium]